MPCYQCSSGKLCGYHSILSTRCCQDQATGLVKLFSPAAALNSMAIFAEFSFNYVFICLNMLPVSEVDWFRIIST